MRERAAAQHRGQIVATCSAATTELSVEFSVLEKNCFNYHHFFGESTNPWLSAKTARAGLFNWKQNR